MMADGLYGDLNERATGVLNSRADQWSPFCSA